MIKKEQCKECRDLPEGVVIRGHDHHVNKELKKTCLNKDCPERTGGECTAGELTKEEELRELKKLNQDIQALIYQKARAVHLGLNDVRERVAIDNLSQQFNEKLDSLLQEERQRVSDGVVNIETMIEGDPENRVEYVSKVEVLEIINNTQ